jgi:hypothetical protein
LGDHPAGWIDLLADDVGFQTKEILARLERHHHLFQRGIPGSFTNTVNRALHLPRPVGNGGERIGHRQTEIVVAMGTPCDISAALCVLGKVANQRAKLGRDGVSGCVWNI